MELKYQATYRAKGLKAYSVGEIQAVTPALELAEPRLRAAEGKLEPGEICMLIFGITAEEYAWREGDVKKLDALAEQLRKHVPADRLIAWRVVDLKGKPVQRTLKPQTGESIDGGAFAQAMKNRAAQAAPVSAGPLDDCLKECCRLQKLCAAKDAPEGVRADWSAERGRLAAELKKRSLWVAYDANLGGRLPFAGYDGRIEIFTAADRADRARVRIAESCGGQDFWIVKEIPKAEQEAFFELCAENGLSVLRVDNGFAPAELSLHEVREGKPCENAELRGMLLREAEYGVRWNRLKAVQAEEKLQRGALESMLTLRNFAWRALGNALLYTLCAIPSGEGGDLATAAAAAKDGIGLRVVPGDKCVVLNEKQSGASRLPVFTSKKRALVLAARVKGAQPVRMTFDDLIQRVGAAEGLLIDPDDLGYRLPKAEFDKVRELRAKPPMAVRVKPAEEASTPAPASPAPRMQPEMGELPDPDSFDLPPKKPDAPATAAEAPQGEAPEQKQERKAGFFRRFMKK